MNEVDAPLPEINEMYLSYDTCQVHGHYLVSVPRNKGEESPYKFKCPIRTCAQGILKA
jgi:hypothetical protein